ncbi:MAG: response regulator transcription factor [Dehalococcoidia bacterium]|nr:response regulator transcription factor [Dehalococcoidia bacterium]
MRIAVVESGELNGELLTFAARRHHHSVVTLQSAEQLRRPLPFTPSAVALVQPSGQPLAPDEVRTAREALPAATVFVVGDARRAAARAELFRAGAHDVIPAPYDPFELLLRLEAWARPAQPEESAEQRVELHDLVVDAERYRVRKNGQDLAMTPLEVRVLYCLAAHSPNLTPAERLLSFGWGVLEDPDTSLIRTHVCHLRRKLEKAGGVPVKIKSKHTLGYTLLIGPDVR